MRAVGQADRRRGARNLLHGHAMGEIAQPCPAPFLLDRDAEKPELAELRPQLARKFVGAVDFGGARRNLGLREQPTVSRSMSISLPRSKSRPGRLFGIIVRSSRAPRSAPDVRKR